MTKTPSANPAIPPELEDELLDDDPTAMNELEPSIEAKTEVGALTERLFGV